jgi:hypothetical protein
VSTRVHHVSSTTITGNGRCTGTADVLVLDERGVEWTVDGRGRYTATIPRAFGGWTCGRNVPAAGARVAELGHGLDPSTLRIAGDRLTGSYVARRHTHDTQYRFTVRWELRRER